MKKILEFFGTKVFKQVGDVVDSLFTSEEERLNARNKIFKVLQDAQLELQRMQTDIILAEAKGNWLQRSWRPILMLAFGFIVIYVKFLAPLFDLKIPELAPELDDTFVIYPYVHHKIYNLKPNEFLGIRPQDLNQLKFSKWNVLRNKLVVLQTVSFQNKKGFNTHRLLRAIDNNTLLSKLPKTEQGQETDVMLPYNELKNTYQEFPELLKNTSSLLDNCTIDFDFSQNTP